MKEEVESCLMSEERSEKGLRASFHFAPGLSVFEGHFPGLPIVPGVYLIEAARIACEHTLNRPLRIAAVEAAKFTAEVGPGETVNVEASVAATTGGWICQAAVTSKRGTAAQIRLRLVELVGLVGGCVR